MTELTGGRRERLFVVFVAWVCLYAGMVGLTGIVGCGIAISDNVGDTVETRQSEFTVSKTPTLIVENANGDVAVAGGADADRVQVTARLRRPERLEYLATQEGDTVRITVKLRRGGGMWWNWLPWRSGAANIVVAVPPKANLDIRSSNGNISARRVAGTITLATSNGSIEASGGDGAYDLRSSNGNITVAAGRGAFNLHTSNGSIWFEGDPDKGTQNLLRTSNGNIRAQLTGEAPSVSLLASTSNGGIRLERSVAVSDVKGRNRLEGMIGDGAAEMTLATSNGTVTIE